MSQIGDDCYFFYYSSCHKVYIITVPKILVQYNLTFKPSPAEPEYSVIANSVDPHQLTSEEANWSGSALFAIKYVNLYQQPGSSDLIGWKLEMGVAS